MRNGISRGALLCLVLALTTSSPFLSKGKKLVARATAQSEKTEKKADRNSIRFAVDGSKAPKIIELRLSGESQSYKLGEATQVSQKTQ
ncbi:MAG: hypothetical protein FJW26_05695 [Acidimicrobiia bacterium]|nr:hypothetical protein [Acidimicrobiia bacterium]